MYTFFGSPSTLPRARLFIFSLSPARPRVLLSTPAHRRHASAKEKGELVCAVAAAAVVPTKFTRALDVKCKLITGLNPVRGGRVFERKFGGVAGKLTTCARVRAARTPANLEHSRVRSRFTLASLSHSLTHPSASHFFLSPPPSPSFYEFFFRASHAHYAELPAPLRCSLALSLFLSRFFRGRG